MKAILSSTDCPPHTPVFLLCLNYWHCTSVQSTSAGHARQTSVRPVKATAHIIWTNLKTSLRCESLSPPIHQSGCDEQTISFCKRPLVVLHTDFCLCKHPGGNEPILTWMKTIEKQMVWWLVHLAFQKGSSFEFNTVYPMFHLDISEEMIGLLFLMPTSVTAECLISLCCHRCILQTQ